MKQSFLSKNLLLTLTDKRHEDIPQVKMCNPNLYKNKSYEMVKWSCENDHIKS